MSTVKLKISDSILKNVDDSIKRINDTELSGFHVRLGKTKNDGTRSTKFYLYYRIGGRNGKQGNFLLGSASTISTKEARKQANIQTGKILAGEDIGAKKIKNKSKIVQDKSAPILNNLLDQFVIHAKLHRKRPEEVERAFNADVRPTIGKIKLIDLEEDPKLTIKRCLDPIKDRGSLVQSNKTLVLLKQVYRFGVARGELSSNPLQNTKRNDIGGVERARTRSLTMDELTYFYDWLKTSTASIQVKQCFKLIILTGCRSQEMTLAKWQDIDFRKNMWCFPEENRKGEKNQTKEHLVPLTELMKSCLLELKNAFVDLETDFIFPSVSSTNNGNIDRAAPAKFLRRRFISETPELNMQKFVPHDLRRTFRTHLSRLGVNAVVCEKLLSHQLEGMLRVYDVHDYMNERREALELWSDIMQPIIEG
ncbi:tyrosine-type recombinase/integrase [Glaciecola petra]|uniref:Site-specific integrase n=1 Tax=Glaciecola petra TaxID=3075602 RepID=A0ABU2ZPI9_9ALTE|nr:site-specific integrase [Aestuariibacter sp. P117]MDT0594541.1 site-specific integrase [Aestuariibacter sp. P117]